MLDSMDHNEFGFMRYSASDFWKNSKVDFRDSGRVFKNKVVNISTSMLVDTCPDTYENPTQIYFETREEESSDQCSILNEFEKLLLNDNFASALRLLENFIPHLVVNGSMLALTLIKLSIFESVIKEDKISVLKCLRELRTLLSSFDVCYHKIEVISTTPEILRSRYYSLRKKEIVQRLVNILNYELIGADMFFLPATQEPILKYEKIHEETSFLQSFEDGLLYLAASFVKVNHIVCDFDEFLFNSNITYDANDLSHKTLISEFINTYEKSSAALTEELTAQPAKSIKPLFTIEKGIEKEIKAQSTVKQYPTSTDSDECSLKSKETKQKNVKLISLKNVSFKTIKRENIDKKNIRKFKRYVALRMKQNSCQTEFLHRFSTNLLFPPFTFEDCTFKSFNTSYIVWLFSHKELVNLYEEYIDISLDKMMEFLSSTLDMKDPGELEILKIYLKNMATIFSNLSTDNSSIFNKKSSSKDKSSSESLSIENHFMRLSVDNHNTVPISLPECSEKDKENFILELFDNYVVDADI